MTKVIRTIKYQNGAIEASASDNGVSLLALKNGKMVAQKSLPRDILGNKDILETMIGYLKSEVGFLMKEDDSVLVLRHGDRVTIRGIPYGLALLYRKGDSNFYQNFFLPYDYNRLSLQDYQKIFP